jgi:hypothetical protein
MNNATDWVWYVHDNSLPLSPEVIIARNYLIDYVLPALAATETPHEYVYDNVADTINLVIPEQLLHTILGLSTILKDARFIAKEIPKKDTQASTDLREALLGGSNFGKRWD